MKKKEIKSMDVDQLKEYLKEELGAQSFRAKQVFQWIHQKNVNNFDQMRNVPKDLRQELKEKTTLANFEIEARREATDGTIKYLFRLPDGETIESVYLPYSDGRKSICVSTQVGCAMGCSFCATGQGGLVRHLSTGEIVEQVYAVQRDLDVKITNLVLMGMGEPLHNMDPSLKAVKILNHPKGSNIGMRRITLSTSGLVPQIRELADENIQIVLAISLHAPNNKLRNQLMPINKKYPLEVLISACRDYIKKTNRRITFEYALMKGTNDTVKHARQLAQLLQGLLCHVNLIPINPVQEAGFARPKREEINRFLKILRNAGVEATVREERGADIEAACGQLRSRNQEVDPS